MFTGIVEETGTVRKVVSQKNLRIITLTADRVVQGTKVGDSICVDGVCLTVTAKQVKSLTFAIMKETMTATTLHAVRPGTRVNLERALTLNSRIGGHFISGHIDGVGVVQKKISRDNYVEYQVALKAALMRYVVPKGSVCIDGISLTVGAVGRGFFSVYLIPHTLTVTTIGTKGAGDKVNVETDLVAKYILQDRPGSRKT